jgi:hypothetical protein
MTAISIVRGRVARPRRELRRGLWLLPAAFALHVLEESAGFTEWVRRNGRADYSMDDFVQINATGLVLTIGATLAVARRPGRGLFAAYYALLVTQQALFNPLFHVGSTVAYRDWSPGTASAVVLFPPLWWRLTRRALRDRMLGVGGMSVGIAVGGAVHAAAVANQVFGLSLSPGQRGNGRGAE